MMTGNVKSRRRLGSDSEDLEADGEMARLR